MITPQASSLSYNARNKRIFSSYPHFPAVAGCYNWVDLQQDSDPFDLRLCS